VKGISRSFYAEMGNSKSKILVEFKSKQLLFGTLWNCSSGLVRIPQTWPAAMTLAVRLPARGRLTPQGANRQATVQARLLPWAGGMSWVLQRFFLLRSGLSNG